MLENLIRALMKIMRVSDEEMREYFDKGQVLIVDGHKRLTDIDDRLARIERALEISKHENTKEIEHVTG